MAVGKEKDALQHKDKDNKENRERSEERLSGAKQDLFELLERVQCSRIDDQRCVLPTKLSQVGHGTWDLLIDHELSSSRERRGISGMSLSQSFARVAGNEGRNWSVMR